MTSSEEWERPVCVRVQESRALAVLRDRGEDFGMIVMVWPVEYAAYKRIEQKEGRKLAE